MSVPFSQENIKEKPVNIVQKYTASHNYFDEWFDSINSQKGYILCKNRNQSKL